MAARVSQSIRRKGKVIGHATASASTDDEAREAIRKVTEEAGKQAKAYDIARHTGRKAFQKKQKEA